jgi:hypothetical protein
MYDMMSPDDPRKDQLSDKRFELFVNTIIVIMLIAGAMALLCLIR